MRRRFSDNTYFTLQQAENAIRAQRINTMLDQGRRVLGNDGPDGPGTWHDIAEATEPLAHGIICRTTANVSVRIYAYDATDAVQPEHSWL